jgi:hypothetical protein
MELALEARGQRAQMTDAQFDGVVEFWEGMGGRVLVAVGVLVLGSIIVLLTPLVYLVVLRLLGSEITFRQTLSTYLHGALPLAVAALLTIPVILSGGDLSAEKLAVRDLLASSLAFLAPADAGYALKAALASVDFFALWSLVLNAVGFRIVGKVSPAVAWGASILVFLLGVGLRVGLTALAPGG